VFALSVGCGGTADPGPSGPAAGIGAAPATVAGVQASSAAGVPAAAGTAAGASSAAPAGAGAQGAVAAGTGAPGGKLSFATDVYERVIRVRCISCHSDAPSYGGLAFFPGGASYAYGNLVNVSAGQAESFRCRGSGLMRVKPGEPEQSLLYLKLTMPPCGNKMPPPAFTQPTEEQVSLVRQWIAEGAAP
jgi:hypothetical protein